jgi:methionyl-tRNA synthetase
VLRIRGADEEVVRDVEQGHQRLEALGVSNDFFIRTSDREHEAKVREILQRVYDAGHVYRGKYEGWYCPRCADFKTESELGPGNTCPIHRIPLEWESEDNYFFALSSFQEPLERLYAERQDFVLPRIRFNEALSFIRGGLQDVSLTRARLRWGVSVPWDESQVFYVWFDALLNYLTALSYARDGDDLTPVFWPADYHVIGKDILKFHAVFWPALLLAAGYELPRHVFIHGFLLVEGQKMGKSLGNALDPIPVVERFGADALRYYCFRDVTFGQDGSVSAADFETRYETELANEYGNLASRTLAMVARYRDGVVPDAAVDPALGGDFEGLCERVCELFDQAELTGALDEIWQRVRRLNRYVEERAPWQLAKDDNRAGELDTALRSLVEGLRVVTVLVEPFVPRAAGQLLAALGQPAADLGGARYGAVAGGGRVEALETLFPKR